MFKSVKIYEQTMLPGNGPIVNSVIGLPMGPIQVGRGTHSALSAMQSWSININDSWMQTGRCRIDVVYAVMKRV